MNCNGSPRRIYCKQQLFDPYLADLDEQLAERFNSHQKQIFSLQYLVPAHFGKQLAFKSHDMASRRQAFLGPDDHKILEGFRFYATEVDEIDCTEQMFLDEYQRWKEVFHGKKPEDLPANACTAYAACLERGKEWFPVTYALLKVTQKLPYSYQTDMPLGSRF